ncbi:MAG: DUF3782 domain-containing protein [Caldilineaceae bacterium]
MQPVMSLEELEEFILERLPRVLERDPRFVTFIEGIVAEKFPRRDEFARLLDEIQQHRKETAAQFGQVEQRFEQVDQRLDRMDQRFAQIDQRFAQVDQRIDNLTTEMREGFRQVQVTIDRLGQRWGIRNESIFRQTMQTILEKSFGAKVEERIIQGEQFDCIIINGEHILVEISASVGPDILRKLQRKRQLYSDATGVTPARILLVVGSIHSRRAAALREAGIEVIEPEEEDA